MNEHLSKSISEIMAFFDFNLVVEMEQNVFHNDGDTFEELVAIIKAFVLDEAYKFAKESYEEKKNRYLETAYHLRFEYVHDNEEPYLSLFYAPVYWNNY